MLVILCKSHDSDLTFEPCVTPPIISRFRPYLDALNSLHFSHLTPDYFVMQSPLEQL